MLQQADQLEEQMKRRNERDDNDADAANLFSDQNAVITISGDLRNIGQILNTNTLATTSESVVAFSPRRFTCAVKLIPPIPKTTNE